MSVVCQTDLKFRFNLSIPNKALVSVFSLSPAKTPQRTQKLSHFFPTVSLNVLVINITDRMINLSLLFKVLIRNWSSREYQNYKDGYEIDVHFTKLQSIEHPRIPRQLK